MMDKSDLDWRIHIQFKIDTPQDIIAHFLANYPAEYMLKKNPKTKTREPWESPDMFDHPLFGKQFYIDNKLSIEDVRAQLVDISTTYMDT